MFAWLARVSAWPWRAWRGHRASICAAFWQAGWAEMLLRRNSLCRMRIAGGSHSAFLSGLSRQAAAHECYGEADRLPRRSPLWFTLGVALLVAFPIAGPAMAQDALVARVQELNRAGQWNAAAELAAEHLASVAADRSRERCELMYNLAYARTRLGQFHAARSALASFARECFGLPDGHWLKREVGRLRAEIGDSGERSGPDDDAFWKTVDPASVGLDAEVVEEHRALCEQTGADACLLVFRGAIVQEWTSAHYREPMMAMSVTKSITGLLVGMLVDDGRIPNIDQRVCTYIAQWCAGTRGRVTLRHLLSMTSGLPRMWRSGVGHVSDKNTFVIGLEPTDEPGAKWAYSNEGVQLLSPVLDSAAGEPIQDYARKRLFEPLGMYKTQLQVDERGHAWTYADMLTTPRDLARIGLLMLNRGMWEGHRIISEEWIKRSTTPSQALNPAYGLLWWLHDEPRGYAGEGYLDTDLHVFPDLGLVAVRMQAQEAGRAPGRTYEREALRLFRRMVR